MVGGGSPKVLRMAGAKADIVSINFNNASGKIGASSFGSSTPDETLAKISWIREGAGPRFDQLELEIAAYFATVSEDVTDVVRRLGVSFGLQPETVRHHPHVLVGSVSAIAAELERRREMFGISYVTVPASSMDDFAPVVAALH
jgi:alkanesulfonate monooxygenase SsuD/methylene tetrahydromethanopterin reductase-like flavin-dependent oxidoreductase (luciferase family)